MVVWRCEHQPAIQSAQRPPDILVATPGRLLDHVRQKTVDLSGVEILVLDEADRMLDMGFIRDIRKILALLPKQRQNLLFSATFSGRDQTAGRRPAERPGADRSGAPQHRRRAGRRKWCTRSIANASASCCHS